jgi:hypothetical protein
MMHKTNKNQKGYLLVARLWNAFERIIYYNSYSKAIEEKKESSLILPNESLAYHKKEY